MAHTVAAPKVPAWTTILGIALFGLALYWLHHLIGQYRWRDILAHVHAIPPSKVLRAALFTVLGYGCLTLYDALAVRFAAKIVSTRGHVGEDELNAVRAAGYDDAQIIEIVLHVALNTWTNYINEIAVTDIDFPQVTPRKAA